MKRRPDARFVVGWFGGFDGCASTFVCGMDVREIVVVVCTNQNKTIDSSSFHIGIN